MLAPAPEPRPESVPPVEMLESFLPAPRRMSVPVPVAALCLGVLSLSILGGLGYMMRDGKSALEALANGPARLRAAAEPAPVARFDRQAATAALAVAVPLSADACGLVVPPGLTSPLRVTFLPNGTLASSELVGSPYSGTHRSDCMSEHLRRVTVPPFAGAPVTITQSVSMRTTQIPAPAQRDGGE